MDPLGTIPQGDYMRVSEARGPKYSTLNSRILIIRTPKHGTPNFQKLPNEGGVLEGLGLCFRDEDFR